ncbi:MAG: glutathione S-transferase N-terminal domain-containing protein [Eubacterium sp.]|nr:glutathione S-transferase N-terminal domain-containing protein [Eubacterium sp.]
MKLALYKYDTCPFCQRVLREIQSQGRTDIEMHDTMKNADDQLYLMEHGGMNQVPCLFIDGKPLYESMDIIDWLRNHPQS